MSQHHRLDKDYALTLDRQDPLRHFRDRFYIQPGGIYMDGNSLGLASRDAERAILDALEDWKSLAIDGWTAGERPWFYLPEKLGAMQAELVGAEPDEVVVTGTTTVNLHALVTTFYRPTGRRRKIIATSLDFPSDVYALQSQIRLRGYNPEEDLILVPSRDGRVVEESDLIAAMSEEVALVVLPSVLYRSGQLLDMPRLTSAAHERGILIGFDCCHSAGSVPHRLHEWGVDFAFWCTYKYLNAGPGAVASLFVHKRHFGTTPGLTGWFGSDKQRQFDMSLTFQQAPGAGAWQISTPTVLGAAPLYGSLQLFQEAGMDRIRQKSLALTDYMIFLIDHVLCAEGLGFHVGTPRDHRRRGGHVALEHAAAVQICKALKARGIVPDFRQPNVIRLAPVALYTSFADVWETIHAVSEIVRSGKYKRFSSQRGTVA